MPGISDPGAFVVSEARTAGLTVIAVPGPTAVATALAGSGAPADRFVFEGFLPRRASERRQRLAALAADERTIVLYEAPHRLPATLADLAEAMPHRTLTVARELTKLHEQYVTGTPAELRDAFATGVRGELTIVIHAGPPQQAAPDRDAELADAGNGAWLHEAQQLVASGTSRKDAARAVASRYGLSRRLVYQALLATESDGSRAARKDKEPAP